MTISRTTAAARSGTPAASPSLSRESADDHGWGTPFAYRSSRGHDRFVNAGPNRKFDPTSLDLGKWPAKSDDIVYADIELIRP